MHSSHNHNHDKHNHSHSHSHDNFWSHSHNHHAEVDNIKVLFIAFAITFLFMIVEFIGGLISNSLALLSDAGHMLSDSTSLVLAFLAIFIGTKKANQKKTYGYKRIETITAFINGFSLIFVSFLIIKEGIERIIEPVSINSNQLILIAFIGLLVNICVAIVLFKNSKESLNVKGAFLHVMGDLLGSIGAISAGLVIKYTGWIYADPLISFVIAGLIMISSFALLKETFHLLMEGTPKHINIPEVEETILSNKNVINIHDLHIWSLSDSKVVLTGHVVIDEITKSQLVLDQVSKSLHDKFEITHSTLQIETVKCELGCN